MIPLFVAAYGLLIVGTVYATKKFLKNLDRAVAQANLARVEVAVEKHSPYRTAEKPGPSSDGSLPIQSSCPKCKKATGRAFFAVTYHAETDRLHVMCGVFGHDGKVICGCGAKWAELPGDAK